MKEIKIEDEKKEIIIIHPTRPKFFKFEPNKTYEVEVDLQRFPEVEKFKNKNGNEYWACIYNLRILKEDEKKINSDWMQRRIGVGNVHENNGVIIVKPRMYSEFSQLLEIRDKLGPGIHRCIVKTRAGNRGQVLAKFRPAVSEYSKSWRRKVTKDMDNLSPQELAEKIKKEVKEKAITIEEIAKMFKTDEKTAEKALNILVNQGDAVKIKDDKFYINP